MIRRGGLQLCVPSVTAVSSSKSGVIFTSKKGGLQRVVGSFFLRRAWPAAGPDLPVSPTSAFTCLRDRSLPKALFWRV